MQNFTYKILSILYGLSYRKILIYKLAWYWDTTVLKLPIWPKRLFKQFHFSDIVLLIVPCHAARFAESCYSRSSDIGEKMGKNGPNFSIWPEWIFFFFLNFHSSNFCLLIVSYYLLQWFLLTHSKSLVVGGNSWSRSWDISLYNFGQQLAQSFPFSPKQDFLGNFTKVIFITRYKLAWCWTIVEPNLPIWPKRDFFEGNVFGIFRYMIFISLFSPIILKTLNKLDKWNMKLKLARFSSTIRPTLLIWSKRKRIF